MVKQNLQVSIHVSIQMGFLLYMYVFGYTSTHLSIDISKEW